MILLSFEHKIDEKRLDVEFNSEEDTMSVNADKDAIYQIIYNLCHNAIKFSSVGGKFVINILIHLRFLSIRTVQQVETFHT